MRGNIAEIHDGGDILLLGRFGALGKLPREMRQPRNASLMLRGMMRHSDAVRQVRLAFAEWSAHPAAGMMSDDEIYQLIDTDLQRGKIQGVPIPHARMSYASGKTAALQQAVRPMGGRRGINAATASSISTSIAASQQPAQKPVSLWSNEERISSVIRRTIPKVPGHARQAMMGLLSPESIATMALTMGIVAAANLTPYGWAADAVLAGLAFGFGGLAALEALGDLVECFRKTAGAQTEVDIELASSALAKAVVVLGALGLMAILHKISSRKGTGSSGDGEANAIGPTKGAGGGKTGDTPSSRRPKSLNADSDSKAAGSKSASSESTSSSSSSTDSNSSSTGGKSGGKTAAGTPKADFLQPRKINAAEPGAAPMTPALRHEIREGAVVETMGTPPAKPGWPELSKQDYASFKGEPTAIEIKGPAKIYRVIGSESNPNGAYWSPDPPPATEAAWRSSNAVTNNMSGDGGYVVQELGEGESLKAWSGPIRAQQSADGASALPGGGPQLFLGKGQTNAGSPMPTPWN